MANYQLAILNEKKPMINYQRTMIDLQLAIIN